MRRLRLGRYGSFVLLVVLLLVVLLPLPTTASSAEVPEPGPTPYRWVVQCIDCPRKMAELTDRSLRLDSAGHPHVVFGQEHLYHGWHDGTVWNIETADDASVVGRYAALALDAEDKPHISYYDGSEKALKYAYRDAAGWHTETVDSAGDAGQWTSIAVGEAGDVHIGYNTHNPDTLASALKYAHHDGANWQTEEVDGSGQAHSGISLALDAMGDPHVSYAGDDGQSIKYAFRGVPGWTVEVAHTASAVRPHTSLAVNRDGRAYIAFSDEDDYSLLLGRRDESGWHVETVDGGYNVGCFPSMAVDSDDHAHISHIDYAHDNLKYTYEDEAGWHTIQVKDLDWIWSGVHTSLALDSHDRPQIMYTDASFLILASQTGETWRFETISDAGGRDRVSLALDRDGQPHVSYHQEDRGDLFYARRDDTGWHHQIVDDNAARSPRVDGCCLALDREDWPHLAYCDRADSVIYARADSQGWHFDMLGITTGLPWYLSPSLTLDADDHAYVAFTDPHLAALRLAHWQSGGWQFETVDDDEQGGWYPSLALGSDGQPQINYYLYTFIRDYEPEDLRYASRSTSGWEVETIDYNIRRGANAYLRLDKDDHPHIVYLDWDFRLRYAWRDDTGWHMEVVATTGPPGAFNVLGLDGQGRLHITYIDTQGEALMVAYRGPSDWHSEIASAEHGHCSGLAGVLDSRGHAHIACGGRDLLYIYAQSTLVYVPLVVEGK